MTERTANLIGDMRYRYVSYKKLCAADQLRVLNMYPHKHFRDDKYFYPVKKNGKLANARRVG